MKKVPLDLCFKGNRDYVHGTDMYNEIKRLLSHEFNLSRLSDFRLAIHKQSRRNCSILLVENNQSHNSPNEYIANFTFNDRDTSYKGFIVEENSLIECRYYFNEDELIKLLTIEGNKIQLLKDSSFSFIETIVAMNKHIHYTSYSSRGKWLFTRLDLVQIPHEEISNGLSIELIKNFNNFLTKSKITYRSHVIGNIYFSQVV
jgi:hypothetical protein